jgi:Fic family protein
VLDRLLVDLSWASSRLEGNTYTRLDTQRLIELGQAAQGKDAQETQMILNHKAAIELLIENSAEVRIDKFTVLNLHAILSDNLISDPLASGRLRQRAVQISGTVFVPLAMPQQLAECFELILSKAQAIENPFEQAFFSMVHLPYLQPFEDVNKRVSRLAANIPLLRNGLCPLSFIDVPERAYIEATLGVYEMNRVDLLRDVFMWAYERSCQRYLAIRQSVGEPDAFRMQYREAIQQAVQAVVRGNLVGTGSEIAQQAAGRVPTPDLEPFVEAVTQDLDHLYEGNYARYRLKLSELRGWGFRRSKA